MAIQEYEYLEAVDIPVATIWPVEDFEPLHEHLKDKSTEFYVSIGFRALGLVHWESSRDDIGYIDGLDPHDGVEEESVRPDEWEAIAVAMYAAVKLLEERHITRIEYPGGSKAFLKSI